MAQLFAGRFTEAYTSAEAGDTSAARIPTLLVHRRCQCGACRPHIPGAKGSELDAAIEPRPAHLGCCGPRSDAVRGCCEVGRGPTTGRPCRNDAGCLPFLRSPVFCSVVSQPSQVGTTASLRALPAFAKWGRGSANGCMGGERRAPQPVEALSLFLLRSLEYISPRFSDSDRIATIAFAVLRGLMGQDAKLEHRLAAIMATDVVGYSKLIQTDEAGTLAALGVIRAAIENQISQYRGRIANTAGDSVLAEFASAVEAVGCAIAVQHSC